MYNNKPGNMKKQEICRKIGWEDENGFVSMLVLVPAQSDDLDYHKYETRIISINWLREIHPMYFQGGPVFKLTDTQEKIKIIAKYEDGRIAALISSYGKGKIAVSDPHPEALESWGEEASDNQRLVTRNLPCGGYADKPAVRQPY